VPGPVVELRPLPGWGADFCAPYMLTTLAVRPGTPLQGWRITLSVQVMRTHHLYRNIKILLVNWYKSPALVCSARFSALKRALQALRPPWKRLRQQLPLCLRPAPGNEQWRRVTANSAAGYFQERIISTHHPCR